MEVEWRARHESLLKCTRLANDLQEGQKSAQESLSMIYQLELHCSVIAYACYRHE